jgi:DNA polymerase-3 subunit gamma/tau
MRDAQSAFDQVISFAGTTISDEDVSTVLGLVGRDLLFEIVEAVLDEDGPRGFALADRAAESGQDLRLVCRELSSLVRDLLIVSVDPARAADGEVAEGERARLTALAARFSREDLMRAFDVLTKAEYDIRTASHPRYHFEMALLRWMHLRKLVPLTDLLAGGAGGASPPRGASGPSRPAAPRPSPRSSPRAVAPAPPLSRSAPPPRAGAPAPAAPADEGPSPMLAGAALKEALLAEVRANRSTLYSLAIAMAARIDVGDDRVVFTFAAKQTVARSQLEQQRPWLEAVVQRLAGRPMPVVALQVETTQSEPAAAPPPAPAAAVDGALDAKAEALSSPAVQALLDVFPAEIRDVEEL